MGSKKNLADVSATEANDTFNDLIVKGESQLSFTEAFEIMEKVPEQALNQIGGAEYMTFKTEDIGKTFGFICEKTDGVINIEGKDVPVAHLRTKTGELFVNGDKLLVRACKDLTTLPCYIRVHYEGNEKSAVGTYKKLTVKTLAPVKAS